MNEILKELDSVFKMISTIPVSGDSVEVMAAAKNELRKVYAKVSEIGSEKSQTEKTDGEVRG